MNIIATGMTALGDLFIFITMICALMLLFINGKNARSSFKRPAPMQFVIVGWLGCILSYVGLVAVSRSGFVTSEIGIVSSMSLTLSALLLYLCFSLMLLGTAWTLRSRRLDSKVIQVRDEESLGHSPTYSL